MKGFMPDTKPPFSKLRILRYASCVIINDQVNKINSKRRPKSTACFLNILEKRMAGGETPPQPGHEGIFCQGRGEKTFGDRQVLIIIAFSFWHVFSPSVLIKQGSSSLISPGKPFNLFIIKVFRFCRFFFSTPNSPIVPKL
jgi:hypothetical protein